MIAANDNDDLGVDLGSPPIVVQPDGSIDWISGPVAMIQRAFREGRLRLDPNRLVDRDA